jgi:hypothetical protein
MAYIAHKRLFTASGKKVEPQHNKLMWVFIAFYAVTSLVIWLHDLVLFGRPS